MGKEFNTSKAITAQKKYCEEHGAPHFAPHDGICFVCNQNIYENLHGYSERMKGGRYQFIHTNPDSEKGRYSGVSVEKASQELITGCSHCHRSYCD